MNLPLRVYLDSADYSVLSDSARRTPEFIDILTRLIEWQEAGKVEFWFSGVHISEMAPLRGQNVGPSVRRTELLVRLCKRHAFIAFDQLIEAELRALHRRTPTETEVRSYEGDWFPELGELLPPGWLDRQYAEVLDELHSWVRAAGANREQRRWLGRVMGKRRIKHRMFSQMARNADESGVEEMVRRYPMRREAAKTIRAYLIGRATRADAESAFLDSLRDPVWMMQWFGLYPDRMAPISDWMREPAYKLTRILETLVAAAKAHKSHMRVAPSRPGDSGGGSSSINKVYWRKQCDDQIVSLIGRLSSGLKLSSTEGPWPMEEVEQFAPGFATAVRCIYESAWNSVLPKGRNQIKESDFVDAVHASYAPYVDIYRTDSYMAPIVQGEVRRYGTIVCRDLLALPGLIEAKLNS